ncbi:MAG TPA: hypothetical protein PK583_00315 [Gammaproteobacteria bacterium]|nr:hypothetical protein [Gammaproteobacteria bacterium]
MTFMQTVSAELEAIQIYSRLEYPAGEIVGIEMKSRATVTANDFKWLKVLQELTGSRFICGIVFYTGDQIIPFGEHLFAMPTHLLWQK